MSSATLRVNTYIAMLIITVAASGASLLILNVASDETVFGVQYEEMRTFK